MAWTTDAVADAGLGAVEDVSMFRERSWGTLLSVRLIGGRRIFFKATEAKRRYEVPVTLAMTLQWPSLAPEVFAAESSRGWMLFADHGVAMSEGALPAQQVELLAALLPAYAEMQRATVDLVDGWIAAGMLDRRVDRLPEQLDRFLGGWHHDELRAQTQATLPAFADVCATLASTSVPLALDHADIHGTNVLVDHDGAARLIDWGDCCATHPYASLHVPMELVIPLLPPSDRPAAWRRLRDAYLEGWGGVTAANVEVMDLALWTGPIVRVLSLADEADGDGEIVDLLGAWPSAPDPLS